MISRSSSPSSVPPGSRACTTVRPCWESHSVSSADWVDLPDPSPPSKVRKRPDAVPGTSGLLLGRGALGGSALRLRLGGSLGALVGQQLNGTVEVDALDGLAARDGGVRLAVGHVRTEPSVADADRLAARRVGVELLEGARGATGAVLRLREDLECRGQLDREDLVFALERARVGALLQVRAVATVLGGDRFTRLRVLPHGAGQVEQLERRREVDRGRLHALEQGCRAGLRGRGLLRTLLLGLLLDAWIEPRRDHLAGRGIRDDLGVGLR